MREVTAPGPHGPHGLHVAAFDFDGTLTRGDTLLPFLAAGLGWPRFAWALLRTSPWLVGHAVKLVRNDVAKARLFAACLSGLPTDVAAQWAERSHLAHRTWPHRRWQNGQPVMGSQPGML